MGAKVLNFNSAYTRVLDFWPTFRNKSVPSVDIYTHFLSELCMIISSFCQCFLSQNGQYSPKRKLTRIALSSHWKTSHQSRANQSKPVTRTAAIFGIQSGGGASISIYRETEGTKIPQFTRARGEGKSKLQI